MVSRCDIRMCIVNILNHRLQVYWWLGGMLRTGWSKRSLSAAVTNTAQNVRFYIITHGIQYNLQPSHMYSAGQGSRVWTQLNLIPASAVAGSSALCCSAVSSWPLLHRSATLAPERQPPHMRHTL